jgi:chloramphenicol 3-O-phosphotransferase
MPILIIITGTPGSGKTTIGNAFAEASPFGVHIQVDFFRKLVKGGYASPHHWDQEVERQYTLARKASAETAKLFLSAGFDVVLDDIVPPNVVSIWQDLLEPFEPNFVLLEPPLEVALQRNRERTCWTVDEQVLIGLHEMFRELNIPGIVRMDSSATPVPEAVLRLRRFFASQDFRK